MSSEWIIRSTPPINLSEAPTRIDTIFFVSRHTNGDIYPTIPFINDICNKLDSTINIQYAIHDVFIDNFSRAFVPRLKLHSNIPSEFNHQSNIYITHKKSTLYVNTWYETTDYFKSTKLSDLVNSPYGYYDMFKKLYTIFNIKLEPLEFYIPTFLWNKDLPYLDERNMFFEQIYSTKILFCNGISNSKGKQFPDNTSDTILQSLLDSGYFVICTHPDLIQDIHLKNFYFSTIKKYKHSDIILSRSYWYENEIHATKCDIVIGSVSGLFLSLMTPYTVDKLFILCSNHGKYYTHEKFNLKYVLDYTEKDIKTRIMDEINYSKGN